MNTENGMEAWIEEQMYEARIRAGNATIQGDKDAEFERVWCGGENDAYNKMAMKMFGAGVAHEIRIRVSERVEEYFSTRKE